MTEFEQFMKQREAVANAYIRGDFSPLAAIVARELSATFFSPRGDVVNGASEVASRYERDATLFESATEGSLQILQMEASDSIAYWVGLQRATVRMRGRAEPMVFNLRITEVFRREGESWKLVHRHADAASS